MDNRITFEELHDKVIDTYLSQTDGILIHDEHNDIYIVQLPCDDDVVFTSKIDLINNFMFNICQWVDNI